MPYDDDFEDVPDDLEDEDYLDDSVITFACEDCDHRWEENTQDGYGIGDNMICPMCGSSNIIEL